MVASEDEGEDDKSVVVLTDLVVTCRLRNSNKCRLENIHRSSASSPRIIEAPEGLHYIRLGWCVPEHRFNAPPLILAGGPFSPSTLTSRSSHWDFCQFLRIEILRLGNVYSMSLDAFLTGLLSASIVYVRHSSFYLYEYYLCLTPIYPHLVARRHFCYELALHHP